MMLKKGIILCVVGLLSLDTFAQAEPSYSDVFFDSFKNYGSYIWNEITFQVSPWYQNYFWWLTLLSLVVWGLELLFPWRKNQKAFRKDFWLDAFYMIFNFYLFGLIIFVALANVTEKGFTSLFDADVSELSLFNLSDLHPALQLIIFFVVVDFAQWFVHVMLHRFDFLWRFHQVHHSVEEMGFAAHLRYHWMETLFYSPVKYLAILLIGGFSVDMVFIVYYISIAIGHLNHANLNLSYGPLKYLFNNPKMHIWHHAHDLPEDRRHGVNFAISLSIWDYLFGTNYIPYDGRDIKLGFDHLDQYPRTFFGQIFSGFRRNK